MLRIQIALLQQQFQAGKKHLETLDSELVSRLFVAGVRVCEAPAFDDEFRMKQRSLNLKFPSFRDLLATAALAHSIDVEFKPAFVREKVTVADEKIGDLRAEVQTSEAPLNYSPQGANGWHVRAFGDRLQTKSHYCREVLARNKRQKGLESMQSAMIDAEFQVLMQNN